MPIAIILCFILSHSIFAQCDKPLKEDSNYDYYKNIRKYERWGFLTSCDDTLKVKEKEVDPRSCGGFYDSYDYSKIYNYNDWIAGKVHKHEIIRIYTGDDSTKITTKMIFCEGVYKSSPVKIYENIETKHNPEGDLVYFIRKLHKGGELISSRFEYWNKGKLVRMRIKYGNISMNIVQGKNPCVIEIFEPKGKSILNLDPEEESTALYIKNIVDSSDIYNTIKYYWHQHCKDYHGTQKLVKPPADSAPLSLNSEKKSGDFVNDENSFLFHWYYLIVVISIVALVVIVKCRKRL